MVSLAQGRRADLVTWNLRQGPCSMDVSMLDLKAMTGVARVLITGNTVG